MCPPLWYESIVFTVSKKIKEYSGVPTNKGVGFMDQNLQSGCEKKRVWDFFSLLGNETFRWPITHRHPL